MALPQVLRRPFTISGEPVELAYARARWVRRFACAAAGAIAATALVGWATETPILRDGVPSQYIMSPVTAIAMLSLALVIAGFDRRTVARRTVIRLAALAIAALPFISQQAKALPFDLISGSSARTPGIALTARIDPVTCSGIVLGCLALMLLTFSAPRTRRAGTIAAIGVLLIGLVVALAYSYSVRQSATMDGTVAFDTAVTLILLGMGLLTANSPEQVVQFLRRSGAGSALARRLLPAALLVPVAVCWVAFRGSTLGWWDQSAAFAMLAVIAAALFVALVWRAALAADRADDARSRAEAELQTLSATLEHRVQTRTVAIEQTNQELSAEIDGRRRAEEELRRTSDDLRALFEASPLAICSLAPDDTVTSWNRAAESLFGWQASEVIGKPLPIVDDSLKPESIRLTSKVMAGEPVTDYETVRRHRDGTMREISISTAALYSAAGTPRGLVAVYTDISNRKQLERQLHQSQKMDAVGRLAGGVAHDFNNILTVIQGAADFLTNDLDTEDPRRKDAVEIYSASQRAAKLTRQLLAFSRQQPSERNSLDVCEIVDHIEPMLRRLLPVNIDMAVRHAGGACVVNADATQIEQIIINLVVNARDAMPHGGMLLIETQRADLDDDYVREHVGTKPGAYVVLAVTDSGVGMSRETQSRIFEPFFTTKPLAEGTGLGLSTVYGIVNQFHGHIWVYSEEGKGTTFKVYLPAEADTGNASVATEAASESANAHNAHILLVEDYESVRRTVRAQLERSGYRVTDRSSGEAALELFTAGNASQFDLILSDIMMPGISGLEMRQQLRDLGLDVPVLLMSGYSETGMKGLGSEADLSPHIEKPFTTQLLASRVGELIGKAKAVPSLISRL